MQLTPTSKRTPFWLGLGLGVLNGYIVAQQAWAVARLLNVNVEQSLKQPPLASTASKFVELGQSSDIPQSSVADREETDTYIKTRTVENGIERIIYIPKRRRFETPIVMQHGMWHGAWCWSLWQALFAKWGWETHAHSLPGHAGSPVQRPIARCTLDYYLRFLRDEVDKHSLRPVLMGHSMGGALTQWYLKHVADDLAAAVLVAPWVSHSMFKAGLWKLLTFDPLGVVMMLLTWDATPMTRNRPHSALRFLVGPEAAMSLDEIHTHLGPESVIVMYQHNPPFWYPPDQVHTPMLWIAGERDPLLVEPVERRSAAHYAADYYVAEQARHNVMLEHNYIATARYVHEWLTQQGVE